MKANRADLRLDVIKRGVEESRLPDALKQLAQQRLDLASDYIDDDFQVKPLVRPGRVIIVDLRDEFIEKDEALGLFVVLMQLFAEARHDGERFNKLVVFDEAHKYIESPDLVAGLVESVREMRHKGMNVLVASQDPPVPGSPATAAGPGPPSSDRAARNLAAGPGIRDMAEKRRTGDGAVTGGGARGALP
ncbi:hypothetical protein [Sphaerisporangium aureirubrum]|uniref:ATP-binding protein n=1 Tax=Sphaerisporangium aureirubrum TaxID=1544736 RepID=A0ABW1NST8_9ACTN